MKVVKIHYFIDYINDFTDMTTLLLEAYFPKIDADFTDAIKF